MSDGSNGYSSIRIPADISRPDRILGPATARQVAIVGGTAAGLWCVWLAVRAWVPPLLFVVPALFVLVVIGLLISTERDGLTLDRLLIAALRQLRTPRRQVAAPEGVRPPPEFLEHAMGRQTRPPAPLGLPLIGLDERGVLDLGADGSALITRAGTVNFGLRTADEQDVLLGGFARWLNSLTGPTQITSTNAPADVRDRVEALHRHAQDLPHPLLGQGAGQHADFLDGLAATRVLLTRSVHLAMREQSKAAPQRLIQRADDGVGHLAACEIRVAPLDRKAASADLRSLLNPSGA